MQQSEQTNIDFKPVIQQKSPNIIRNQKTEDIFYQDAQKRQLKQKEVQEKKNTPKVVTVNVKYTSNNSENQQHKSLFENLRHQSNVSFSIDYLKLGEILQRLGFINQLQANENNEKAVEYENLRLSEERALLCEIWTVLRGDELGGISKGNLCLFLLSLIGITDFKIKELPSAQNEEIPNYQKSIQPQQHKIVTAHQPNDRPKLRTIDKDGNIIFTFEITIYLNKTNANIKKKIPFLITQKKNLTLFKTNSKAQMPTQQWMLKNQLKTVLALLLLEQQFQ